MIARGTLSIVGYGMATAVGFNGRSTCTAMRAGISGVARANLWDSAAGENLRAGRVVLPQWWEGGGMLPELVAPPVNECLSRDIPGLGRPLDRSALPILVLVPPPDRPHRAPGLAATVLEGLSRKLGYALPRGSEALEAGRTGIAEALDRAAQFASAGRHCVIAGVESFLRQAIAEHYIKEQRLLYSQNSNGFICGEAGGAVLVGPAGWTSGAELVIDGVGVGFEPAGAGGDANTAVRGDGLTKAVRDALATAGLEFRDLEYTVSDLNGEHFKFKEATICHARLDRLRPPGAAPRRLGYLDRWHPIEFLGEIGAAIFPCMLGWVLHAGQHGYAPGDHCLLHASEDGGGRVAIVTRYLARGRA